MKKISEVLNNQLDLMDERDWDRIYVAVDLHDTMMPATYSNERYGNYLLYDNCMEVLQWMSNCANIRLILYTSSHGDQKADFMHNVYHKYGIGFDYHNGNPEVNNTETGDFSEKFYYNLMLDDKAGLDPLTDWLDLREHIPEFNRKLKGLKSPTP